MYLLLNFEIIGQLVFEFAKILFQAKFHLNYLFQNQKLGLGMQYEFVSPLRIHISEFSNNSPLKNSTKGCLSLFHHFIDMRTAVNWSISCLWNDGIRKDNIQQEKQMSSAIARLYLKQFEQIGKQVSKKIFNYLSKTDVR